MTKGQSEELTSITCIKISSIETVVKLSVSIHMSKASLRLWPGSFHTWDVKVHMKPKHTLRSFLSYPKDQIPNADSSKVIYKVSCRDCDASYSTDLMQSITQTHLSLHVNAFPSACERIRLCVRTRSHPRTNAFAFACERICLRVRTRLSPCANAVVSTSEHIYLRE